MGARAVIFLIVFIDLIGFGIVLPMLPVYAEHFGASGFIIGIIVASFSVMQVIFSPFWGRLSDRIGRKPVILISVSTGMLSYLLFAWGSAQEGNTALFFILTSRLFAGACGGNINVTQAYIADITPAKNRIAGMGLIGMAFSLGLISGPAIGALSAHWGIAAPPTVAAILSSISLLLALLLLKESIPPQNRAKSQEQHSSSRWETLCSVIRHPQISFLCCFHFISTFCFSCYEVTLGLLAEVNLHFDTTHIGYIFAWHGIVTAIFQGLFIRRLIVLIGEGNIILLSFIGSALSLFAISFANSVFPFFCAVTLNSISVSLNRPTTFGLISRYTNPEKQGEILGLSQSIGNIARIISPICCLILFGFKPFSPYILCGTIAILTAFFVFYFVYKHRIQDHDIPEKSEENQALYM